MRGGEVRTELGKGDELATSLSGFIDPMDGPANGLFQVEPSWLRVDGGGFVLLENGSHGVVYKY